MSELLDAIRSEAKTIFYGANTCWWTHQSDDLQRHSSGLPCDPVGGMLLETDDVDGFLNAAEERPEYYGRFGLRAFEAAHHSNGIGPFKTWDEYNAALAIE